MSTFKKCKVVILPTKEKTDTYFYSKVLRCGIGKKLNEQYCTDGTFQFQHIYITSDAEIKEGDFCINLAHKLVVKPTDMEWANCNKDNLKKIIAATDKLNVHPNLIDSYRSGNCLPQPSQSFIQKYVEEYNKGNIITDILVEYELVEEPPKMAFSHLTEEELEHLANHPVPWVTKEVLKVNLKDNTITIKKVKDSWTRDEVKKLVYGVCDRFNVNSHEPVDVWIEENL